MNNPSQIGKCSEKHRLCVLIRDALMLADELNCDVVAIHLNTALVKLTGEGVAPSETGGLGSHSSSRHKR